MKADPSIPWQAYGNHLIYRRTEDNRQDRSHLGLSFEAERPPPPHHVQQELLTAAGESGEIVRDVSQALKENSHHCSKR